MFLAKHLPPKKARYALWRLEEQTGSNFLCTLQPDNFNSFLNQIEVPEKRYIYGGESHGSNVKYTMRIRFMSTGDHELLGKP